ncbi:hypothetical protein DSM112329_05220 [Paraconexibacter sp. AEG42_29]|uniref:Stage II sporulation protein M n=1 Tax=Paraconexibacter sp. AEG42_29 TaxID=2997339 RepID=A0AAU7B2U2_9ACTN
MDSSQFAFVQGVRDTRTALVRWNNDPWSVLRGWLLGAALVTAGLLGSVWVIGSLATPDPSTTGSYLPGFNAPAGMSDVGHVLYRNALVLALHSLACVAGFIAGSSLPAQSEGRGRLSARLHDHIGRAAIIFVVCATTFSLVTQALTIGQAASSLAADNDMSVGILLLGLLPHAIPELMALFLPLAAWIVASRQGDWDQLLAATFVTTALAVPVIVVAAFVEVFVSPHLLVSLRG